MVFLLRIALLLTVVCLFSGCVSMSVPKASTAFSVKTSDARKAKLQQIKTWQTEGAFSIRYRGKAEIANFNWQQSSSDQYVIKISSALALYQLKIIGNKKSVALLKNGAQPIYAKTPEALLKKTMGWYLPITPLVYWYRGLPAPKAFGSYHASYDRYGHLLRLAQAGWVIRYASYRSIAVLNADLPQSITLQQNDLVIKIVTKNWRQS